MFKVSLKPPSTPGGTGLAALAPTFLDNATAANGNTGTGTVQLHEIDIDSNAIVPPQSPHYAGQFVVTDQTAYQLVFVSNVDAGTGLTALKTTYGLDDIRWATTPGGTLYLVDLGGSSGASTLYKITGPFVPGAAYASNDTVGSEVDVVNLTTGKLTPFIKHPQTAKGLVYLDASGNAPLLSLSGASAAAATPGSTAPAAAVVNPKSDSDTASIVLSIIALVLGLRAAGFVVAGRRSSSGA